MKKKKTIHQVCERLKRECNPKSRFYSLRKSKLWIVRLTMRMKKTTSMTKRRIYNPRNRPHHL